MEEKQFVWNDNLTTRMLQLRFDNDNLFKSRKRPWGEFYKLLLENGFPQEMTIEHVRKKWGYTWDTYKIAKKEKNTNWKFYRLFEKHFGKIKELDKYESWSNKWRLKLITCIEEAKAHNFDKQTMWRTIEKAMRSQSLPEDCCIQDIVGLWHHLKMTFSRKYRLVLKKGLDCSGWPLYNVMLGYFNTHEPDQLISFEKKEAKEFGIKSAVRKHRSYLHSNQNEDKLSDFLWSKHITESFLLVRLQNDFMFSENLNVWKHFVEILKQEHGFPDTLTSREACRKWSATYREYQKAKATKNKSWLYYNLFELYLGEGSLSMNPLLDWQEEWSIKLIRARTELEPLFVEYNANKQPNKCWREVEKILRSQGLPLDHSLLNLQNIWSYLTRTFKWKRKFANKGVLKEQWPYYEAMAEYNNAKMLDKRYHERHPKHEMSECDYGDDDHEDDVALFQLKQKIERVDAKQCRACGRLARVVDMLRHGAPDDVDTKTKFELVCGIQLNDTDNASSQICFGCLEQLENAYEFRRKCQETDKQLRDNSVPVEIKEEKANDDSPGADDDTGVPVDTPSLPAPAAVPRRKATPARPTRRPLKRLPTGKYRYEYWKVCDVCGKRTKNLASHLDVHNEAKPYACGVCDKRFKFKSGLIMHRAVHEAAPRKTCDVCGKAFHVMSQFRRHYAYHANERSHACSACDKRFNSAEILRVHERTHTDERPFACPTCGKAFRTAGCVTRHRRIVHHHKTNK